MRLAFLATTLALFAFGSAQTVCIDPGHPSEVGRGTTGKRLSELHANWLIAKRLESKLESRGIKVVLTKSSEREVVRNRRRAEIANEAHADLMVRLHCDASNGSGFTVYYPDRKGTSGGVTGPSDAVLRATAPVARRFHTALADALKGSLEDNGLMSDLKTAVGSKQGALTGSIFSEVPVVLVEMVVLTNPKDEAFLSSRRGQDRVAEALAQATMAGLGARTSPSADEYGNRTRRPAILSAP